MSPLRSAGTKNKLGGKATGAGTEMPKASRGERYGEGVSPPHPTRGPGGAL